MRPWYKADFIWSEQQTRLLTEVPWESATEARRECFMASEQHEYTYGSGRGTRTYRSVAYHPAVLIVQTLLNDQLGSRFNVCFLNRYTNEKQHLGWHADDSPGMLRSHPIAVVSFGAAREIWWRKREETGVVPLSQRQLLESGSLFVMPAGFQQSYQHRIPKGDKPCGERISLTFRRFEPGSQ